jgi:5-oxoprolinase (ATP-hydrolysing)
MGLPLHPERAETAVEDRRAEIEAATGTRPDRQQLLEGYLAVANELMAGAVKTISVAQGYEPASFALVAFGGAGGMHACALASLLGIQKVLLPVDAGLLSAYGLGQARIERFAECAVIAPLEQVEDSLAARLDRLEGEARAALMRDGVSDACDCERRVFIRFLGQRTSLEIPHSNRLREAFRAAYEGLYGHWAAAGVLEVEHLRVTVSSTTPWYPTVTAATAAYRPSPDRHLGPRPVYDRDRLRPGAEILGPALLVDDYSTAVLEAHWRVIIDATGTAIFTEMETGARQNSHQHGAQAALELYANRMQQIAESMGAMLRRTARSVNVKDRLDFSCALLDDQGFLVANAQHIPVHLGGLGLCARRILAHYPLEEGDAIVTNHPAWGGSHLPDITILSPCFLEQRLIGYCINRAHHAEIGGVAPGSMPPQATRLIEEGVVIEPFYLVKGGKAQWQGMRDLLEAGPWPSRMVAENLADLNAQLAANQRGTQELAALAGTMGTDSLCRDATRLRQNAAGKVSAMIDGWERATYRAEERLDDGSLLCVRVTREDAGRATLDFSGSAPVHPGNLNGTEAVCTSVIMYVLRLLVDEPLPLNDGMLDPIKVILPTGILSPQFAALEDCPAVAGGNVELSQRLTDTLLKAFGLAAASQGTMNNLLFGNACFGYYETIGGGCGAIDGQAGADGVHQHMTNTRITDVEILEHGYPVRLWRFALRPASGGPGRWAGGRGVIRELEFLEPVTLSVIAQRRRSGPYGLAGGGPGSPGRQALVWPEGRVEVLPGGHSLDLAAGARLIMETPGGGGVGREKGSR